MGIPVDPPNINTAREICIKNGHVQYGMSAIKGVGSSAIAHIVEEREEHGLFQSVFDFASRIDARVCKKNIRKSNTIRRF